MYIRWFPLPGYLPALTTSHPCSDAQHDAVPVRQFLHLHRYLQIWRVDWDGWDGLEFQHRQDHSGFIEDNTMEIACLMSQIGVKSSPSIGYPATRCRRCTGLAQRTWIVPDFVPPGDRNMKKRHPCCGHESWELIEVSWRKLKVSGWSVLNRVWWTYWFGFARSQEWTPMPLWPPSCCKSSLGSWDQSIPTARCAELLEWHLPCHVLFALAVLCHTLAASLKSTRGSMGLCQSQMIRTSVLRLNVNVIQKWRSEQTQSCYRNCKLKVSRTAINWWVDLSPAKAGILFVFVQTSCIPEVLFHGRSQILIVNLYILQLTEAWSTQTCTGAELLRWKVLCVLCHAHAICSIIDLLSCNTGYAEFCCYALSFALTLMHRQADVWRANDLCFSVGGVQHVHHGWEAQTMPWGFVLFQPWVWSRCW